MDQTINNSASNPQEGSASFVPASHLIGNLITTIPPETRKQYLTYLISSVFLPLDVVWASLRQKGNSLPNLSENLLKLNEGSDQLVKKVMELFSSSGGGGGDEGKGGEAATVKQYISLLQTPVPNFNTTFPSGPLPNSYERPIADALWILGNAELSQVNLNDVIFQSFIYPHVLPVLIMTYLSLESPGLFKQCPLLIISLPRAFVNVMINFRRFISPPILIESMMLLTRSVGVNISSCDNIYQQQQQQLPNSSVSLTTPPPDPQLKNRLLVSTAPVEALVSIFRSFCLSGDEFKNSGASVIFSLSIQCINICIERTREVFLTQLNSSNRLPPFSSSDGLSTSSHLCEDCINLLISVLKNSSKTISSSSQYVGYVTIASFIDPVFFYSSQPLYVSPPDPNCIIELMIKLEELNTQIVLFSSKTLWLNFSLHRRFLEALLTRVLVEGVDAARTKIIDVMFQIIHGYLNSEEKVTSSNEKMIKWWVEDVVPSALQRMQELSFLEQYKNGVSLNSGECYYVPKGLDVSSFKKTVTVLINDYRINKRKL
jgi:hypothetical protein